MLHTTTFYDREDDSNLLKYARENREDGYFNDVTIQAGKDCFPANRMILACYSPFFETMFKSRLKERYENKIEIKYGNGQFIKQLVDFIYNGNICIDSSDVMGVLAAADFLQLDNIKQVCLDHLEKNLGIENCFDVLAVADRYGSLSLKPKVVQFMSENFEILSDDATVKSFTKMKFMEWITSLNRKVLNETSIYYAIVKWIKHNECRNHEFVLLFNLLNLNELSSTFLEDVVSKEKLVKCNLTCTNAVLQIISQHLKEVRLAKNSTSIVVAGGFRNGEEVLEIFNCFGEAAKLYPSLPRGSCICCSMKFDGSWYVLGGSPALNGASTTMFQLKLNQKLLKWKEVAAMHESRTAFSSALFMKMLFVAGGVDEKHILSSTEYYDPLHNLWQMAAFLNQRRKGHSLVASHGKLFALGGKSSQGIFLNSVEQLQSIDGKWEFIKPMTKPRFNFVAVKCKDCIYAIGGQCGNENHTTTSSVEKFDPIENNWNAVKSMNFARSGFSASVLQGRIFVVGGLNTEKVAVMEIECYNPALDSWSIVKTIDQKLFYHSAIAV